jgi:hypothetical protein
MKRTPGPSIALFLVLLATQAAAQANGPAFVLDEFLRESAKLNTGQIAALHGGKAVAVVLDSAKPDEIFVLGAVQIDATPESYLRLANDFDALRKLPGYLAIQRFRSPPRLDDLRGFTISDDDFKELKKCKTGDCEVQLPAEAMQQFQQSIDWKAADAASQATALAQQMALQALLAYQQGGNAALGVYRDKEHPARVAETFQALLSRLESLPVYLPELNQVLRDYPAADVANARSDFYWERVDFGLKPTLRMVHQVTYHRDSPAGTTYALARKQLYASHYFQSALDLTVCLMDPARLEERGFYLITVKASQQAGLRGPKGSVLRKIAVSKTRASLERALTAIKQRLEAEPG